MIMALDCRKKLQYFRSFKNPIFSNYRTGGLSPDLPPDILNYFVACQILGVHDSPELSQWKVSDTVAAFRLW